ncbi:MAG: TetR/AcrR family transcriptional regulator [Nevskiales bacterium]
MASNTRNKLIHSALDLFRSQGYHQTGLNQILAQAGSPKGSLYHYFPGGKEQLACEAVQLASDQILRVLHKLSGADDAAGALDLLFDSFAQGMKRSWYSKGCPIATIVLEEAAQNDAIRAACDAAFTSWLLVLSETLAAFSVPDPDKAAATLLCAIEGALLLCRTQRSTAPLRTVQSVVTAGVLPRLHG